MTETVEVKSWGPLLSVVFVLVSLGAACIAAKGFGDRSHFEPDGVREWVAKECTDVQVQETYQHLFDGVASPGEALYYYRCRGPNEYKEMLKEIRRRETWWIKHHPQPRRDN